MESAALLKIFKHINKINYVHKFILINKKCFNLVNSIEYNTIPLKDMYYEDFELFKNIKRCYYSKDEESLVNRFENKNEINSGFYCDDQEYDKNRLGKIYELSLKNCNRSKYFRDLFGWDKPDEITFANNEKYKSLKVIKIYCNNLLTVINPNPNIKIIVILYNYLCNSFYSKGTVYISSNDEFKYKENNNCKFYESDDLSYLDKRSIFTKKSSKVIDEKNNDIIEYSLNVTNLSIIELSCEKLELLHIKTSVMLVGKIDLPNLKKLHLNVKRMFRVDFRNSKKLHEVYIKFSSLTDDFDKFPIKFHTKLSTPLSEIKKNREFFEYLPIKINSISKFQPITPEKEVVQDVEECKNENEKNGLTITEIKPDENGNICLKGFKISMKENYIKFY